MLLANKNDCLTVLGTLNLEVFKPLQNNNPIAVFRRKLIAKCWQDASANGKIGLAVL